MKQTQASALARALDRAHKSGIQVTGKGTRRSDNIQVYTVSSKSQGGRWRLVAVMGPHLVCDCEAGRWGMICQHPALVHERIIAERVTAQVVEAPVARGLSTHKTTAPAQERDRAILRRSQNPFSLLK